LQIRTNANPVRLTQPNGPHARTRQRGTPVSHARVARVWRHFGIQPYRSGTFTFSTDP
jgi:hypothetical protein